MNLINLRINYKLKLLTILLSSIALNGCESMKLKPYTGELKKVFIIETKRSKEDAFERSAVWLAKNLGDSNSAIKINDSKSSRLVAKIVFPCKDLKRPDVVMKPSSTDVKFNVDLAFKENKIKFEFEMLGFTRELAQNLTHEMVISDDKGQTEAVNACFEALKDILQSAVDLKPDEKNW